MAPHHEFEPPQPHQITNPTLLKPLNELYARVEFCDPSLWATKRDGSTPNLAAVEPNEYIVQPIDTKMRSVLSAAYQYALAELPDPLSPLLSPWERSVVELVQNDVAWKLVLLETLSPYQPLNAGRRSVHNALLVDAQGYGRQPFNTKRHVEDFLSQLRQVPATFEKIIRIMGEGVALGDTAPLGVMEEVERQLSQVVEKHQSPEDAFYPVRSRCLVPMAGLGDAYRDAIQNALSAYNELLLFIRNKYLPYCHWSPTKNPYHADRYALRLMFYADSTTMTPERYRAESKEWVEEATHELHKLQNDKAFIREMGRTDFDRFLKILDQGPRNLASVTEIREAYSYWQAELKNVLTPLFPHVPKFLLRIMLDESTLAQNAFPSFQVPSADGKRPGIYIDPVYGQLPYNGSKIPRRLGHEIFGHPYQMLTQLKSEYLPDYSRFAMLHPWGTEAVPKYVEFLIRRLVHLDVWQKGDYALAALHEARVAHMDALVNSQRLSRAQLRDAQQSMHGYELREEIRVLQEAGEYGSYYSCMQTMESMWSTCERVLGATAFRALLPEYHDILLREPPMPPTMLRKRVKIWLRSKLAQSIS